MDQQPQEQDGTRDTSSGDDVVRIRTDVPVAGDLTGIDDRSTRRLGRLPQHATAPVGPSDADGRRGRMRRSRRGRGATLLRVLGAAAGTGLVTWGALILAGIV